MQKDPMAAHVRGLGSYLLSDVSGVIAIVPLAVTLIVSAFRYTATFLAAEPLGAPATAGMD